MDATALLTLQAAKTVLGEAGLAEEKEMLEAVTGAPDRAVLNLRVGGVCLMVGAVLFATVRLLHGDTPAADAEASLNFVQHRSTYAAVHVFAALIMLVTLTGVGCRSRRICSG